MTTKYLRGGSWLYMQTFIRAGLRNRNHPLYQSIANGFRIARPTLTSKKRVLRGGSWLLSRDYVHIAKRLYRRLARRNNYGGFRVLYTPNP